MEFKEYISVQRLHVTPCGCILEPLLCLELGHCLHAAPLTATHTPPGPERQTLPLFCPIMRLDFAAAS